VRAVIQRVSQACVTVGGEVVGSIEAGLVVLLGVERGDTTADADYLAAKIVGLRIFPDESGKMNFSVTDTGGAVLVVSQFTLLADTRRGRRPSYDRAAPPEEARSLYDYFVRILVNQGIIVSTGRFQEMMSVSLVNQGPVTLICESRK